MSKLEVPSPIKPQADACGRCAAPLPAPSEDGKWVWTYADGREMRLCEDCAYAVMAGASVDVRRIHPDAVAAAYDALPHVYPRKLTFFEPQPNARGCHGACALSAVYISRGGDASLIVQAMSQGNAYTTMADLLGLPYNYVVGFADAFDTHAHFRLPTDADDNPIPDERLSERDVFDDPRLSDYKRGAIDGRRAALRMFGP